MRLGSMLGRESDQNDLALTVLGGDHGRLLGQVVFADEPATLQEVADATICFSRAWKMGLATTPTFYVRPEQVTKEANQGYSF